MALATIETHSATSGQASNNSKLSQIPKFLCILSTFYGFKIFIFFSSSEITFNFSEEALGFSGNAVISFPIADNCASPLHLETLC